MHTITQAHHIGSHRGKGAWAWDADLQDGDPVFAVAPGVIRQTRDDSERYGCDQEFAEDANYVILDFEDGTEALYLHLKRESVAVAPGDRVARGQFLGRVGKSGRICGFRDEGVHLHFQIQEPCQHWYCASIPARFDMLGDPFTNERLTSNNCGAAPRCAVAADSARVFDDESRCFDASTEWWWREEAGGHDGKGWRYTYTSDASASQSLGTWRFEVRASGMYRVEVFLPDGARSRRARYELRCARGAVATDVIDQMAGGWVALFASGEGISLESAQRCEVILGDATGEPYREDAPVVLAFDALRVTPLEVVASEGEGPGLEPWLPPEQEVVVEELSGGRGARDSRGCATLVAEGRGAPG
ncbi:MAG: peptidoglycan DD-metalloendopeptidase family protein, partial [Myxococcota bacterium]|nr:peptidoglycan DD-metalloendopeptidase family protein [Myxococcota bacterium]